MYICIFKWAKSGNQNSKLLLLLHTKLFLLSLCNYVVWKTMEFCFKSLKKILLHISGKRKALWHNIKRKFAYKKFGWRDKNMKYGKINTFWEWWEVKLLILPQHNFPTVSENQSPCDFIHMYLDSEVLTAVWAVYIQLDWPEFSTTLACCLNLHMYPSAYLYEIEYHGWSLMRTALCACEY